MQNQILTQTDNLLTIKEAATYMRCSKVFIWKIRKAGKLRFLRAGRKVLFNKADIDHYLNKGQVCPEKEVVSC